MTSQSLVDLIAGYRWFGARKIQLTNDEIYAAGNLIQPKICSELHLLEQIGTLALVAGNGEYSFPAAFAITAASNASPIVLTIPGHSYHTGDTVQVFNVGGNTAANGRWKVTYVSATQVSLDGSTGNAGYTTGGQAFHCLQQAAEILGDLKRTSPSYRMIRRRNYQSMQVYSKDFEGQTGADTSWYDQTFGDGVTLTFLGVPSVDMQVEFKYYRIPVSAEAMSDTVNPIIPSIYDKLLFLKVLNEVVDLFKSEPDAEKEQQLILQRVAAEEQRVLIVQAKRKHVASVDHTSLRF